MRTIVQAAQKDYNATILATQRAAAANNIETVLSVVRCGGNVERDLTLVPIGSVPQLKSYDAYGSSTPLFESVNVLIDDFLRLPDAQDPEVTFIVMATTDGENNSGRTTGPQLAARIKELQKTDRWTFVFRVPKGDARDLIRLGIEPGNILEWDQTERGVQAASQANDQAFDEFYKNRASGTKSTKTFYTSMKDVTVSEVKAVLTDISSEVNLWPVATKEEGTAIREFVEGRLHGQAMLKGAAFYQLVKKEDKIQANKKIVIRDKNSGAIYYGDAARDMVGLPKFQDARVRPEDHGLFDVFIQSTSVNRKVNANTQLMYWPGVGKAFKEGISAR
jgi:hypothetical protein